MSIINLLKSDVWSEADIVNAGREIINAHVSEARQNELRTIMLGHIAQMRTATSDELIEINLVQQVTEAQVSANAQARADMALLQATLDYEAALQRLTLPEVAEPATITVTDINGNTSTVPNPAIEADALERLQAQALIDNATVDVLDLYALRHPVVVEVEDGLQ